MPGHNRRIILLDVFFFFYDNKKTFYTLIDILIDKIRTRVVQKNKKPLRTTRQYIVIL